MAERSEAVEEKAVRDGAAVYSVKPEIAATKEIPPGYKRTEVGVIPDSWEVKGIYELEKEKALRLYRGKVISQKDIDTNPGEYPIYSSSVKNEGVFGRYGDYMFDEELITWSVDGGGNFFYRQKHKFSVTNVCGYMRADHARINYRFLASQLQLLHSRKAFDYQSKAHPSVIRREYVVPLPPLHEQRAIATALSDADALIASLDRLIAKKRAIKQAAMQQLLTGQTRLPGFTGEWEAKRLGDVGTFYKGQGIRRDNVSDEGVPCIRYGEIYTRYGDCVLKPESRVPETVAEAAFPLRTGDILFAGSGETAEEIGMCVAYLGEQPAFAGGDIVVLRPNEGDSAYLGRLLNHPTIAQQKARLGQGDAVVHISARNLAQIELHLPKREEQTAIATVLSDMDTEIGALERRRDKARQTKQGMMQQLLTGRVRLVTPEVAA